jgi:hypothetical protein
MHTLLYLKKCLIEEKLFKGTPLKQIAQELGLSNSYLSNFIDFVEGRQGSHEVKFDTLLKIIKRYCRNVKDIQDIIKDFSTRATKPQNLRMLLEFADEHHDYEFLAALINRCKESSNRGLESISNLYELLYKRKTSQIELKFYREQLSVLKTDSTSESDYLILILESYILYDMRSYSLLKLNIELLDSLIQKLDCEKYLLHRYHLRKEEIKMRYFLMTNQQSECNKVADGIIESSDNERLIGSSYYSKGLSNLFYSFPEAVDNLEKAEKIFKKLQHTRTQEIVMHYIGLAKCIHDKATQEDFPRLTQLDQIYFAVKTGKTQLAKELYKNLLQKNTDQASKEKLPFIILIKGLIENEKDILWQSYAEYIKQGELLFSNLPLLELEKIGSTPFVLT